MSNDQVDKKVTAGGGARGHDILHDEVLTNEYLINDAIEAENAEHAMDMWSAAKKHLAACLWAFLMCFTIVSSRFIMFIIIYFVAVHSKILETFGGR